jgi:CHAT domain-containing protein
MIDFYEELLKHPEESQLEALHKSKTDMIASSNYAAPYYWSPFILIGK